VCQVVQSMRISFSYLTDMCYDDSYELFLPPRFMPGRIEDSLCEACEHSIGKSYVFPDSIVHDGARRHTRDRTAHQELAGRL